MITLIAAVAENGVIGNNNTIPWHLPEDFKHFSETTRNHAVIMGASTWDSLPAKFRPLPQRANIIVSRNRVERDGHWAISLPNALAIARFQYVRAREDKEEVFIIGGASIYEQAIGMADRLLISEVAMKPAGDTFFPTIGPEWQVRSRDPREGFTIVEYTRG